MVLHPGGQVGRVAFALMRPRRKATPDPKPREHASNAATLSRESIGISTQSVRTHVMHMQMLDTQAPHCPGFQDDADG